MTIAKLAVTLPPRLLKSPSWNVLTLIALLGSACHAQTFNYSGSLSSPNQVFELSFTLTAPTNVTIETTSWAAGNFDPVMWLYDSTGTQVEKDDDACNGQGCSPIDRDSLIQITGLAAGTYTAIVSAYDQHYWRAGAAGNPAGVLVSGWSYNGAFANLPPNYAVVFTTSLPIATPITQLLFPPSDIGPAAPVLMAPASGSTSVSPTPTLSWNAVTGTNGYTVYVGTTNPPLTSLGQTTATSYTPSVSLAPGTTYYWRIASRDPNNNNTENPSLVGTFTTATAAPPAAPTLVSPVNGATGLPWLPALSWKAVSGTNGYNVYLGTTNPPTASTLTNNLSYTPTSSLTPGVTYYWYVASRDPNNNNAQSASGVWSFTTSSLLPSPALLSPTNGSTGLSPSTSLSWSAVSGSNGYTVYLGVTNPPTSSTLSTGASFTPSTPLTQGSTYYWRISSRDPNNGNFESPSAVWSFSVAGAVPAPILSSPANGAAKVATTPTLSWNPVNGSAGYAVYLGTTNPPTTSASSTGTSFIPSTALKAGTTYYWMAASIDPNNNNKQAASAVWSFTTVAPPPAAPTLSSPANGATGIAVTSGLSWNGVTGTAGYSIYLGTTNPPTAGTQVSGATYTPSTPLSSGTVYYWMVASRDPNNNDKEADSAVWSFTTAYPVVPAPILASPSNGATAISTSTTLNWNAASGTAGYNLYLGTTNPPQTGTFTNATLFTPSSLLISGTKYYWYVTSIDPNNNNKQAASPVWSFTTAAFPTATLTSPVNNAAAVPVSTSVTWNAVPNAGGYTVYLGTNNPPTTTYVSFTNSFTPYAPLNPGTKYYWYISSHDPQNLLIGSPSSIWSFTTASGFPAPGLSSPANGTTGVPVTTTFTWNPVAGSAGYIMYVGTTNPPTASVAVSGTTFTPSVALGAGTTYYWYAASRDPKNGDKEAPSPVWSFVTAKAFPTPTLNSPLNGAASMPLSVGLSWTSVPQSAGYNVYLGTTNPPVTSTYSSTNSFKPTLTANTTYYWYVASRDPSNNDMQSPTPVWSFTTAYVMPPPGQASPANGAAGVPVTSGLNWNGVNGSNGYTVYFGTSNPPTASTVVSGTSFGPPAPLNSGTTYYWYVSTRDPNNNNKETPSPVWSFTTSVPLAAPTLLSPANQSNGVPTEPNLTWATVSGSAGYTVYLDTANPPANSTQTAGSPFTPVTALVPGTQYNWMVSSRDPNNNYREAKSAVWSFTTAPSTPYSSRRTITINHAQVPNTDQSNFPFLFNTTDPLLRSTANGGHVTNTSAFDVIFTSDPAGTQKLDHEIEYYNGATGQFIAWVRIPALSHLTDTVIYMFYGNPAIAATQENKTGVWDANYSAVYHMADNAANTNVTDSTAKHPATNQVDTNSRSTPGQVDGALIFNGTSDFASTPDATGLQSVSVQTVSFWMMPTGLSGAETNRIITDYTDANDSWAIVEETAGNADFNTIAADMKVAGVDLHLKIANNSLTPNIMYYVTAVFANSVPSAIYLNGTSLPLLTPNEGELGYGTMPRFTIGANNDNSHPFPGILDEVRISTIVRSPDWIATEYNNQANPGSFYSLSGESNAAQLQ